MPFPINPSVGDTYVENDTTYEYLGPVNGWFRKEVGPNNDTTYIGSDGAPGGVSNDTEVIFNDNGSLASDSGLTYNKTTDALSGGAFVPTGSTVPSNGVYLPSANNVAISTNDTPRVNFGTGEVVFNDGGENYDFRIEGDTVSSLFFVDASTDRVGIATTSPQETLHVSGTYSDFCIDTDDSTVRFGSYGEYDIGLVTGRNTAPGSTRVIIENGDGVSLRVDSSGRLLVGTVTSPAYQLQLQTDSAGKPSTNTWTIVSDERIKDDIELADLDICYEAIKNIPLKRFKWKDEVYTEEQVPDRHKLGWIAQDVEVVFPKAVRIHEFKYNQVFEETVIPAVEEKLDEDGNVITPAQPARIEKGELISEDVIKDCRDLNADQLYAAMYGAIQKLITKVEALESELSTLKSV